MEPEADFPSSYIPTDGSSVTRNADVLTTPQAGTIDYTVGTAYAEYWSKVETGNRCIIGGQANTRTIMADDTTRTWSYDGATFGYSPVGADSSTSVVSAAATWGNNLTAYRNGIGGTIYAFDGEMENNGTLFAIGSNVNNYFLYGNIRHVKIFNSELTATEVADL